MLPAHHLGLNEPGFIADPYSQREYLRRDNPLLTFGLGTHYRPGAPLARLELQVVFKSLFQRWLDLRLSDEVKFSAGFVIRGPKRLLIEF